MWAGAHAGVGKGSEGSGACVPGREGAPEGQRRVLCGAQRRAPQGTTSGTSVHMAGGGVRGCTWGAVQPRGAVGLGGSRRAVRGGVCVHRGMGATLWGVGMHQGQGGDAAGTGGSRRAVQGVCALWAQGSRCGVWACTGGKGVTLQGVGMHQGQGGVTLWGWETAEGLCRVCACTGGTGVTLQGREGGHGQHGFGGACEGSAARCTGGTTGVHRGSLRGATRSCTRSPQEPQNKGGVELMETGDRPWCGDAQAQADLLRPGWSRELAGSVMSSSDWLALN